MTNRLLGMFYQYLTSNQELKLNETFKIYLKVLSVEHARENATKKKKTYKRKHYGNNEDILKVKYFYAIDVPSGYRVHENCFKDKCLVTGIILGYLQNSYFKTNRNDKRYLYAQSINSSLEKKKNHAGNILYQELLKLFEANVISPNGPYDLEKTCKILSNFYSCQIFIFNNVHNSCKLVYSYPECLNDSLMPIYLFQPLSNTNHVLFIKCIDSFYRHNSKICLGCKKAFKSLNKTHLCPIKKTCFACRKFFASSNTFLHEKNKSHFCDSKIANKNYTKICGRCNLTLQSFNCFENHNKICFGRGYFGWKCLNCNRFFSPTKNFTSNIIKNQHQCGSKFCRTCYNYYFVKEFHLCDLKKETVNKQIPKLAFISYAITSESIINFLTVLKETSIGHFDKLTFSGFDNSSKIENDYHLSNYFTWPYEYDEYQPKVITNHDLLAHIDRLKNISDASLNVVQKFIKSILTNTTWLNTTFIITDHATIFYEQLLNELLNQGIQPKIIMNGCSIYLLTIEALNMRFLLSNMYFDGSEYDILALFDKKIERYFFPEKFNSLDNFEYKGAIPNLHYFIDFKDSQDEIAKKETFIEDLKKRNFEFDLSKETEIYCEKKAFCLMKGCLAFISEIIQFQTTLEDSNNAKIYYFLHPFGNKLCSISGYVFKLFKLYYLNDQDIFAIAKEYGSEGRKTSRGEHMFCSLMDFKHPEKEFLSEFNNFSGQKYFKECIPDLYSNITKEAFFYNGCSFSHYHVDNCLKFPNASNSSLTHNGQTFKEVNDIFYKKIFDLKENNKDDVKEITVIQECLFQQAIKVEPIAKDFFKNHYKEHCLYRLRPRVAVRGGFSEAFILKYDKDDIDGYDFHFLDINGLYTFVCTKYDFPVGPYKIILGRDISNIEIINDLFYYQNIKMNGTMLVTVLAPNNLFIPFLMYRRSSDQQSLAILCKTCAEKNIQKSCHHNDKKRAFTSTYFISELEYALKLGYKITAIHECHFYSKTAPIFKDFSLKLTVLKLLHTNLFKNIHEPFEKQTICENLNSSLNLNPPYNITPEKVSPNDAKKNLMKLIANSLYGKFAQKPKNTCLIVANQKELNNLYAKHGLNIVDVNCINGDFCLVHIKRTESTLPTNRNINCYLTGQITAYARQVLDSHIRTLLNVNCKIAYTDCDSIAYLLPKNVNNPLKISDCLGDFKVVYPNIEKFYAFAPKAYSLVYKENEEYKVVTKIRGFNLTSSFNYNILDIKTFERFLDAAIESNTLKVAIPQQRKQGNQIKNVKFELKNHLSEKRIPRKNYFTYPYGYNCII